jgi:8-oxo-dGTP diphosphatase
VGCSTRPGSHGFGNQPDQSAGAARYRRDPDTAAAAGRDLAAGQTGTASSRQGTESGRREVRREYDHDPDAPAPTYVAPAAFVAVRDPAGALLLVRRRDTGDWELPGGRVEPGESATDAAVRETAEESGVNVEITGVVGIYTDPGYLIAEPRTGAVRQPFAVCFHARARSGTPRGDQDETSDARWVATSHLPALPIHPAIRRRISHALAADHACHID